MRLQTPMGRQCICWRAPFMLCPSTLRWAWRSAYEDGLLQAESKAGAPLHSFVLTCCKSLAARAQSIV